MAREEHRVFSASWVLVSYFLICGGLVVAVVAMLATVDRERVVSRTVAYAACGLGGLVGGFFAGRASRHYSPLEPALAGALIVGSVYLLVARTAVGPLAFGFAEEHIERESLIVGALLSAGGLLGALIGEATMRDTRSAHPLRWLGLGVLITCGAALAAAILANILLVDRTLRDPALVRRILEGKQPFAEGDISSASLAALAGAALVGGMMTQLAAGRRILIISGGAVCIAITGGIFAALALADAIDADTIVGTLVLGGCATMLGLVGATLCWLYLRLVGGSR